MEIKKKVEVTIKNNDKRHKCCSLECAYNNLDNREFPDKAYCQLYDKHLKSYLDYYNSRWFWCERCDECLKDFENVKEG